MRAAEFARVYGADPDWVRVMGARDVVPLQPGQRGPGGEACIDGSSVVPD